jgi:hypothetical protein
MKHFIPLRPIIAKHLKELRHSYSAKAIQLLQEFIEIHPEHMDEPLVI